ncbi:MULTISPECIES: YqhA family protein [Geobacter]|jgi:uncharacterized membrane protein YqhA|uniref:YqhA family protein n=1 Tax=Geobacter TaxID=28231 RepID=UPI00257284D9|nr:YqhA family protein [Geobacter sulfurreducens]BEH09369.1 YqhA family protein [Geobacter sulfurreducens subsp. ethanolicus]BET57251.1 YqhA family protein [Geobacter sp. 60473]HML79982.1 YqhA family protein [Geobacter sulfurreducens]
MKNRLIESTRYIILIAVIGSFAAAVTLITYGGILAFRTIIETLASGYVSSKGMKSLVLSFIEVVDTFLLGTVLYIISLALYELFIDDTVPVPQWLTIHNLDDLKYKLVGVVVVVIGVLFLGQVMTWDGQRDLLGYGVAASLVIAALTYFLSLKKK